MYLNRKMKKTAIILSAFFLAACQQEDPNADKKIEYGSDLYALKEYKVERHPPAVRNGFGMDIYHEGNSGADTLYLNTALPPWHPNNPVATGAALTKPNSDTDKPQPFEYDLLFYSEFAYVPQANGDYSSTGYTVIFLYTDPTNTAKSVEATMVGQGVACFNAFSADSIGKYAARLQSDPLVNLPALRTELHTAQVDGAILLRDNAEAFYATLVIGHKFRPNIGGIFSLSDVGDEAQVNLQPVFLVKTREGLYAKFMVTRFKGVGNDAQKLSLQWQALKTEE